MIRIWEREGGTLHAVGEHCAGLSGLIAWQPNGRHLYAACTRPDGRLSIILYERNGLQHGSFDLHGQGATLSVNVLCCIKEPLKVGAAHLPFQCILSYPRRVRQHMRKIRGIEGGFSAA